MLRNVLITCGMLLFLVFPALIFYIASLDVGRAVDWAKIVQASVTSVAVVAGIVFVAYKLQQFRDFKPHITITQTVSHRVISDSYVHLIVTATLNNSSKVKVDFRKGYFRLQMISPISDEEVDKLYAEVFVDKNGENPRDFQWPKLDEAPRERAKDELIVEPGESHQETCEFIVATGVSSVLLYTYFYNSRKPGIPEGWGATTVYDMMASSQ